MGNRKEKLQIGVKSGDQNIAMWVLAWRLWGDNAGFGKKKKKKKGTVFQVFTDQKLEKKF